MSSDSILRASEHMLDCEVLLYELEERLDIPPVPIDIGYLQSIEFQAVNYIREEEEQFS